jgi:Iron-sulfur cluster assembly accessory protein
MSIKVTNSAWSKMKDIIIKSSNQYGFIYSCSSGGCNGFNFNLDLLDNNYYTTINKNKFLTILENNTTKLYIDPLSEMYLLGTTIDYVKEDYKNGIYESKFKFNINKELMTSCGCGISFSPK